MANPNRMIIASGTGTSLDGKAAVQFTMEDFGGTSPPGITRNELYLLSCNSQIGLGSTPTRHELKFVPSFPSSAGFNFPAIGSTVIASQIGGPNGGLNVGALNIGGKFVHYDTQQSSAGFIITIVLEDDRNDKLWDTFITTVGAPENAPAKLIDVADSAATTTGTSSDVAVDIVSNGATYEQIYAAVGGDLLPDPTLIGAKRRYRVVGQPVGDFLKRVCSDVNADFYLAGSKVKLIKKTGNQVGSGPHLNESNQNIISKRSGLDYVDNPQGAIVVGGLKEGCLGGCGPLSTTKGIVGGHSAATCEDLNVSTLRFKPAWTNAKVSYFGKSGSQVSRSITNREFAAALKGIEQWAFVRGYQSRLALPNRGQSMRGFVAASAKDKQVGFSPTAQVGLNLISNRHIEEPWVVQEYNKIRQFAMNYYGRAFVCTNAPQGLNKLTLINEAWCNAPGYKVLSPFWNPKGGKLRACAEIDANAKWGADGNGVPGGYEDYNNDDSGQYVPIEVKHWRTSEERNEVEDSIGGSLSSSSAGLIIILPQICWSSYDINEEADRDAEIANLQVVRTLRTKMTNDKTSFDFDDPSVLGRIATSTTIKNALIPFQTTERYGDDTWYVNATTAEAKIMESADDLVPWNMPDGSIEKMIAEGVRIANAMVGNDSQAQFYEYERAELPTVDLDACADAVGNFDNGATNISVTFGAGGYKTRYSSKTQFPTFKRDKLSVQMREDLRYAIHRAESKAYDDTKKGPGWEAPLITEAFSDDNRSMLWGRTGARSRKVPVVITNVVNRGGAGNEYYAGREVEVRDYGLSSTRSTIYPRGADGMVTFGSDSVTDDEMNHYGRATCIDGFLQVGMFAVYNYEELDDGGFTHYFTGGVSLGASKIVETTALPKQIQGIWTVSVKTMATEVSTPSEIGDASITSTVSPFYLYDIPYSDQANVDTAMAAGTKIMLTSHGNKSHSDNGQDKAIKPSARYGPNSPNHYNDLFVVNNASASAIDFAQVTARPDSSDGTGGAIITIDSSVGETYTDGETKNGITYNLYFVGTEAKLVEVGDPCFVKTYTETSGTTKRLYIMVVKPTFMGLNALGG